MDEVVEEISLEEKIALARKEMEEKYADIINDLLAHYGLPVDAGFDLLKGLIKSWLYNEPSDYVPEIEMNKEEMLADYRAFLDLAVEVATSKGL